MRNIRQLTVKELSRLVSLCDEYNRPIDHVIRALSSNPENEWILDAGISISREGDYIIDARFIGIKNKIMDSKLYVQRVIPFRDIPEFFIDSGKQRIIYTLLERISRDILPYFRMADS